MNPKPLKDDLPQDEALGVDTLIDLLYKELRRMAGAKFRMERSDHTLQPTAVVHEAYLRLKRTEKKWESETEFRKYAAPVIRHVLVDYARSRPPATKVTLTSWEDVNAADARVPDMEVLALHEVLGRLERHDPELAKIVELHYFGGLTIPETAKALDMPLGTLKDRLTFARSWLRRELTKVPKQ
jgi:RNA polymerase sigma factor (TIGR02999 family)